jgi:hypothetical protein
MEKAFLMDFESKEVLLRYRRRRRMSLVILIVVAVVIVALIEAIFLFIV